MYQYWQDLIQTASCVKFHPVSAESANEHLGADSRNGLLCLLTKKTFKAPLHATKKCSIV